MKTEIYKVSYRAATRSIDGSNFHETAGDEYDNKHYAKLEDARNAARETGANLVCGNIEQGSYGEYYQTDWHNPYPGILDPDTLTRYTVFIHVIELH